MKEFTNWNEVKAFNYPNENKSNYYALIVKDEKELPTPLSTKRGENGWRICQAIGNRTGIFIELTPIWITITIQKGNKAKKRDIARNKRDVQTILNETFK